MRSRAYNQTTELSGLSILVTLLICGFTFVTTADVSAHGGGQSLPFNIPACTARIVVCDPSTTTAATTSAAMINNEAVLEFNIQAAPQLQAAPTPEAVDAPDSRHCVDGTGVPQSCDAAEPFTYHTDLKQLTRQASAAAQNLQPMAETPCSDGFAGEYPCSNIDLLSFLPLNSIGGGDGSDVWGWTDPLTGKEYVLMGRTNGTAFVDISDPTSPIYLGNLPSENGRSSIWRDIKVYQNHAFIVADRSPDHGMQIFDLTQLRQLSGRATTFSATAVYSNSGSAHNVAINEESGFAYIVGTSDGTSCSGGLHMVDIRIPTAPIFAGCFSDDGYTHDTQCVRYNGPDSTYQGQEICFNSNEDTLTIVDVTQKNNVTQLARKSYNNASYSHQGWLTEDHAYFIQNDELDELFVGNNTRTIIWDVRNLDNPQYLGAYTFPFRTIDHNLYVKGNFVYEANYASGLRILDASNISNGALTEVGYFDTYPANNERDSVSAWSTYPYFDSGAVAVSTITEGLFIVKPTLTTSPNTPPILINPGNQSSSIGASVTLQLSASDADQDTLIYDASGLPDGLAINPNTGQISGVPTTVQTADVLIGVDDGNGNADSQSFIWTIEGSTLLGNVDCNEEINVVDALFVLQYEVGLRSDNGACPLSDSETQLHAAVGDVNGDSTTNVIDSLLIMQCEVGIPNSFCSEEINASTAQSKPLTETVSISLVQNSNAITLIVDAVSGNVAVGSFTIKYDSNSASLINCAVAGNSFCNTSRPGLVRTNFIDINGFTDATTIANLTFESDDISINEVQVISLADSMSQARTYTISQVRVYQLFVPLINQ